MEMLLHSNNLPRWSNKKIHSFDIIEIKNPFAYV